MKWGVILCLMEHNTGSGKEVNEAVSACRGEELEYEIQFFDFSPKALIDSVFNIVVDHVKDTVIKMKVTLLKQCPEVDPGRIDKLTLKWQEQLERSAEKTFERFEKYVIDKVFHIPAYVILPDDAVHEDPRYALAPALQDKLNQDIAHMEDEYTWLRESNETLKKELAVQELIIKKFGPVIDRLERYRQERENSCAESESENESVDDVIENLSEKLSSQE